VAQRTPVEEIAAPTLVAHGDADRIVPYENGLELARRIPVSKFVPFEGAGHLLFLESPEDFNRAVEKFLSREVPGAVTPPRL